MKYTTWHCLAPLITAGLIGCSTPPPAPGAPGAGGAQGSRTGGTTGSGGSGSGGSSGGASGGSTGSGGSSASGGTNGGGGSAASGGSSGGGGAQGTGGGPGSGGSTGNPDGGTSETPPATMGCPAGVEGHCSSSSYPEVPGFKLALVEDFDQPLDLDKDSVWTWGDGALDEGQVRMTKAGISFGDGKMRLTVKRETIPGGRSEAENKNVASQMLSSGELRTKYNNYRYGRYEVRFKPPTSDGNFISTMFTFRTPKNINWREVDIELTADVKGGAGSNIVNADGRPGYPEDRAEYINVPVAGLDNQADFHTYAFEWLPNRITWFVDGKKIREYTGRTENGRMIPIPEKSAKIMMNLWIFGARYAFGGQNGARNMYPMVAEYDWFRFYRANDGEPTYPCSPTPACLPAEDKVKGAQNNPGDAIP